MSCLLFPPLLCFHHKILHSTTFLILHKGFPIMKSTKRKPWTNWGRNQFPAGSIKTMIGQKGLLLSSPCFFPLLHPEWLITSTHPHLLYCWACPENKLRLKPREIPSIFHPAAKNPLYSHPLPSQEKGWTPSTGLQAHAERTFRVILASYAWCLAETAACTTMNPLLLN